jgi:hypothetical protein
MAPPQKAPLAALLSALAASPHLEGQFPTNSATFVSRTMSSVWVADNFPHYRLEQEALLKFLKEKFGEGDYQIKVRVPATHSRLVHKRLRLCIVPKR